MKANVAKMSILTKRTAPNNDSYVGFFLPRENFNKMMAYGREENGEIKFLWIHKDYSK